ncbi:MAG: hypothetical protein KTR16_09410 [Acidiferrobacterales bacterium]|nr:hypothetical protein [Acidiferrobacterales bacterium]
MKKLINIFLMCIFVLFSHSSHAHHSFSATFSAGDKITVEGVITEWSFRNPHVLVYYDVTNDDGSVTNWVSEGAAATNMRRRGWGTDTFSPGEIIRVTGDRTHDGSPMTSIDTVEVIDASGQVVRTLEEGVTNAATENAVAEGDGTNARGGMAGMGGLNQVNFVKAAPMPLTLSDDRPNVTGAWSRHGMGLGRPLPPTITFNETGQKAQALFTEAVDPQVFCDAPGTVRQAIMTPHPVRITQYGDRVEFAWEEYGGSRTVYFDERDFKDYKTHLGNAIARYEDDALVIETTNLLTNPASPQGQLLSDEATIIERYTRADSEQFGPVLRIQGSGTGPWIDGELSFDGLKMSVGEYEFIENDCQTPLRERVAVHPSTSFFITSIGLGDGANLGGLAGADAHCEDLSQEMNIGGKGWRAYLSTTGEVGVNARDRIGNGPWYNASGEIVASSVQNLHSEDNMLNRATGLSERAGVIPGRGDEVNKHDILTGSTVDGVALNGEGDTTCSNWTSNSEQGAALVGHYDRTGGGENPTSWNHAHASRGCSQENLQGTGGDGLFYCFASIENTTAVDVDNIVPVASLVSPEVQAQAQTAMGPASNAAPAVNSAPASVDPVEPETVSTEQQSSSKLIVGGGIALLLAIGFFIFRSRAAA